MGLEEVLQKLFSTSPSMVVSSQGRGGVYIRSLLCTLTASQLDIPDRTSIERQSIIHLIPLGFAVVLSLQAIPWSLHWKRRSLSLIQPHCFRPNRCRQNLVKADWNSSHCTKSNIFSPQYCQTFTQPGFYQGEKCFFVIFICKMLLIQLFDPHNFKCAF